MQVQVQVADGTIVRPLWQFIAVTSSFLSYKSTPTITSLKTKLINMKLKNKKNGSLHKFIAFGNLVRPLLFQLVLFASFNR